MLMPALSVIFRPKDDLNQRVKFTSSCISSLPKKTETDLVMTIEEIEAAIAELPDKDFWQLMESLDEIKNERWDQEIVRDMAAGRFDGVIARAKQEVAEGKSKRT